MPDLPNPNANPAIELLNALENHCGVAAGADDRTRDRLFTAILTARHGVEPELPDQRMIRMLDDRTRLELFYELAEVWLHRNPRTMSPEMLRELLCNTMQNRTGIDFTKVRDR